MERIGHRSIEGVRSYNRTSQEQQETLSGILNGPSTCTAPDVPVPRTSSSRSTSTALVPSTMPTDSNQLQASSGEYNLTKN